MKSLRPYQQQMLEYIQHHPRCILAAFMGSGKTVATLTALDHLSVAEPIFPVLVIAPLRVATATWPQEVLDWPHLQHLRVSAICGTPRQRTQALAREADIYTINYEGIPWLIGSLGSDWPFQTLVCDEVSKLRSFRTRQGGKRAKLLSQVAFRSSRFIGLTGTPVSNGIIDLYGQMYFVDRGQRLGKTFTAFTNRWFKTVQIGNNIFARRLEPYPHSQREIEAKVSDVMMSLDPRDHFDLDAPIVNTIHVELPSKARAMYAEMEQDLYLALHDIEAVNAAAKTSKLLQLCIATDTPVLTERGWVPIQGVSADDKLWDGTEWVTHDGLVYQGKQRVVDCFGVFMTEEHKVLTEDGWFSAKEIIDGKSHSGFNRADVRIPDCYQALWEKGKEANVAGPMQMRESGGTQRDHLDKHDTSRCKVALRLFSRKQGSWVVRLTTFSDMGQYATEMSESERQGLQEVRGQRHQGLRKMVELLRRFLERCKGWVRGRPVNRPDKHVRELRTRQRSLGNADRANQQHPQQPPHRDTEGKNDSCGSRARMGAEDDNSSRSDIQIQMGRGEGSHSANTAETFDIMNCGPRNRFVVMGRDGKPLIVHNCSGFIYDESGQAIDVHDAKLDALDSVIEEAAGAPVIVAYQFKRDLERLLARFPQGKVMDKQPSTLDAWNRGEIPILFLHPASAGHGLSLQHGGNILCYYGLGWNLEERLQVAERIGPVRQKQAGYDRPVFHYYLIAKDTLDEVVLARVDGKKSVLEILMQNLKKPLHEFA